MTELVIYSFLAFLIELSLLAYPQKANNVPFTLFFISFILVFYKITEIFFIIILFLFYFAIFVFKIFVVSYDAELKVKIYDLLFLTIFTLLVFFTAFFVNILTNGNILTFGFLFLIYSFFFFLFYNNFWVQELDKTLKNGITKYINKNFNDFFEGKDGKEKEDLILDLTEQAMISIKEFKTNIIFPSKFMLNEYLLLVGTIILDYVLIFIFGLLNVSKTLVSVVLLFSMIMLNFSIFLYRLFYSSLYKISKDNWLKFSKENKRVIQRA